MNETRPVCFDGGALTIADIVALAERRRAVCVSEDPAFIARIERGAAQLDAQLQRHGVIYGITTGYGDSCTQIIPCEHHARLAVQLYTFHGVGLGDYFDLPTTRAILAVRLQSLVQGYSGVRHGLLRQLAALLTHDLLPRIPQEGSVGASGDLTPLSYVAAVIAGEREVWHDNSALPAEVALRNHGLSPWPLTPKETLALMNGTAVMTAQACLVWQRAAYLAHCASRVTSLLVVALNGHVAHFDAALFARKPHPGPQRVAARLRADLHSIPENTPPRLQDRYSLRCAPHIIGVLEDTLRDLRPWLENELNSSNDNPLIDPDSGQIWHGGHFYGGHIAQAMDSLKIAVAQLADLMDRQLAQLVDPKFNAGLPANLSGATGAMAPLQHGCKALQIAVSAWAAEALKATVPASVFSRSTECHNQDKVSLGTLAARDAEHVVTLTEQIAAALLIASVQAVELRGMAEHLSAPLDDTRQRLRAHVAPLLEDRALEHDVRWVVGALRQRHWPFYPDEAGT